MINPPLMETVFQRQTDLGIQKEGRLIKPLVLIIFQGFETTRIMRQMYSGTVRISAMNRAQIVSSLVYVGFFILMIPLFPYFTSTADVAGFIDVIGPSHHGCPLW